MRTAQDQIARARRRRLRRKYGFALPVMYICCPDVAHNDPDDWTDTSPLAHPRREVQFHGTCRWCPTCMSGCHCLDFVEVLGTEEHGHDDDMSCVWCRVNDRAPYEARLAGALLGEGGDL